MFFLVKALLVDDKVTFVVIDTDRRVNISLDTQYNEKLSSKVIYNKIFYDEDNFKKILKAIGLTHKKINKLDGLYYIKTSKQEIKNLITLYDMKGIEVSEFKRDNDYGLWCKH